MTGHLEIERKYDADSDFDLPDLSALGTVGESETYHLVAEYFDTEDLRLAARGITLRRRSGGSDDGWHLKIPVGPDAKREVHSPLDTSPPAIADPQPGDVPGAMDVSPVPGPLGTLVAAVARGAALRQVAVLETRRTIVHLMDTDGRMLAELADDLVCGTAPGQAPVSWREIEVELGAAESRPLLGTIGKRLRKAGARPSGSGSKLARLLSVEGRPDATATPHTAGEVAVAYLAAQVSALQSYDPRARLAEPDAVHRMRVAVRRIRSVLKSYGRVLDRTVTDPLQPELRWLTEVLGTVRDLEVIRERFTARLAELPADVARHRGWLDAIAAREEGAYRSLNAELSGHRYFDLLDALDGLVTAPPLTSRAGAGATTEVPKIVRAAWRRLARSYAAIPGAEDPDLARHETRKDAKRARYAAEAARPVLGAAAKNVAAQAEAVQEALGGYMDGFIAQRHLSTAAAATTDPGEIFTLGVLSGIEHCAARDSLAALPAVWSQASDPSHLTALNR